MKSDTDFKTVGIPMASGVLRLWFKKTQVEPVPEAIRWEVRTGARFVISPERKGECRLFRFVFRADTTSPVIVGSVKDLFQSSTTYDQELDYMAYRLMRRAIGDALDERAHLLDRPDSPIQRPSHPRFPFFELFINQDTMCRINLQRRNRLRTDKALYASVAYLLAATGADPSEQLDLFCLGQDLTRVPCSQNVRFTSEGLSSEAVSTTVANLYYVVETDLREAMKQFQGVA